MLVYQRVSVYLMAKLHLMAALAVFPVDVVLIVLVLSNGELIHNNMYDSYPLVSKKGNWKSTVNGGSILNHL